ncbi:ABC transporter permease [Paenibacillus arenosi]|uniref:ABC transporter permease n=1 Tax=Paenibacillus arenosi TaxID=2774142 RepID=A0ABR9AUQ6_9BACL|nr:ABC transporter permease [Paenibacillus arenosi]MBD8497845.1 ABC transporter permease [Paenibacillus arenosi]
MKRNNRWMDMGLLSQFTSIGACQWSLLRNGIWNDIRIQFRHGFYYVYALVSTLYIIILHLVPIEYRESANVFITFTDPSVLGFFFIGGLIMIEKGQHLLDPLFMTPYSPEYYIWSKVLSLSVLSVLSSSIIHLFTFGFTAHFLSFLFGVWLTSIMFTLLGVGVAAKCTTVNEFFAVSSLYGVISMVPLLGWLNLWKTPLYLLWPTQASLLIIQSAFEPLHIMEGAYAFLYLTVASILLFGWARHRFYQYMMSIQGGGKRL